MPTTRINLWSCPRNVSTAFMYSFAQRADTTVLDEPLYAHFLDKTGTIHPGREETLAIMDNDGQRVIKNVLQANYPTPVVFFKQMTHHLVDIEWDFMLEMKNILFIRDPQYILNSYTKVISHPEMKDIGVRQQETLLNYLENKGAHIVVLDSKQLLLDPAGVLEQLCQSLDIPYDDNMLHWEKGARKEDGNWAKYWYGNVHNSTGFAAYQEKEVQLASHLTALATECQGYYKKISPLSIKANV